jgi:hypothetical protein
MLRRESRSHGFFNKSTVHKHRNLLAHAPDHLHEEVSVEYTDMIYFDSAAEIEQRRKAFLRDLRATAQVMRWPDFRPDGLELRRAPARLSWCYVIAFLRLLDVLSGIGWVLGLPNLRTVG